MKRLVVFGLLVFFGGLFLEARSNVEKTANSHNPAQQAEYALSEAEMAFDRARSSYDAGKVKEGNAELDAAMTSVRLCVDSLAKSHKSKYYKKAELRVGLLMRRMRSLREDVSIDDRGWIEYVSRKMNEAHEELVAGVMGK